jgi:hypothetical protein
VIELHAPSEQRSAGILGPQFSAVNFINATQKFGCRFMIIGNQDRESFAQGMVI